MKNSERIAGERFLEKLRPIFSKIKAPAKGQIHYIRSLLSMRSEQLAKRIGVSQSMVSQYERGEQSGSITLKKLEEVADALECDVHYVFLPRKPISHIIAEQISKRLWEVSARTNTTMELEDQGEGVPDYLKDRNAGHIRDVYSKKPQDIWDTWDIED